jgi:hypothetical protein
LFKTSYFFELDLLNAFAFMNHGLVFYWCVKHFVDGGCQAGVHRLGVMRKVGTLTRTIKRFVKTNFGQALYFLGLFRFF